MVEEFHSKAREDRILELDELEGQGIYLMGKLYLSEDECLELQEIADKLDEAKGKSLWKG